MIKLLRLIPESINLNLEDKRSVVIIEKSVCDVLELANPIDGHVKAKIVEIDVPIKHSHTVGAADKISVVVMPIHQWNLSKCPKIFANIVTLETKRNLTVIKYIHSRILCTRTSLVIISCNIHL